MDLDLRTMRIIEEETTMIEESFIFDAPDPLHEVFPEKERTRGRPKGSIDSPKIRAERLLRKAVKFIKEAQVRLEKFRDSRKG
jgi:hypothetical protein